MIARFMSFYKPGVTLGELWFGHTTSISSGNGWVGVSYFEKCPAAVPCASADGESGSNL